MVLAPLLMQHLFVLATMNAIFIDHVKLIKNFSQGILTADEDRSTQYIYRSANPLPNNDLQNDL